MASLTVIERRTVEAKALKVEAGVRYWEDAEVNGVSDDNGTLIPCRIGDAWCPTIDLDTGTIRDWPTGTTASIHYKVCDAGIYALLGSDGETLKKIDGYVPDIMCPIEGGYGDYIIMDVDGSGRIAGWRVDLDDFERNSD